MSKWGSSEADAAAALAGAGLDWLDEDTAAYLAPLVLDIARVGHQTGEAEELRRDFCETADGLAADANVDDNDGTSDSEGVSPGETLLRALGMWKLEEGTNNQLGVVDGQVKLNKVISLSAAAAEPINTGLVINTSRDGMLGVGIGGGDFNGVVDGGLLGRVASGDGYVSAQSKRSKREQTKREAAQAALRAAVDAEMAAAARVVSSVEAAVRTGDEANADPNAPIVLERFNVASKAQRGGDLIVGASLTLVPGRRYALVGKNGTGKTTLLEALGAPAGAPRHIVGFPKYRSVLHVKQEIAGDNLTPVEFVAKSDGTRQGLLDDIAKCENSPANDIKLADLYEQLSRHDERLGPPEARAQLILRGLGFDDEMIARPTKRLSGGWRMRVALACALFIAPSVLLLDEPTNHLDLEAVLWLAAFLQGKSKDESIRRTSRSQIVVVVSHDRAFLDEVATDVVLLESGILTPYKGDYSGFARTREQHKIRQLKLREVQEAKRAHLEEYIREHAQLGSNGPSAAAQRKSRMKKLERLGTEAASATGGRRHKLSYDGIAEEVDEVVDVHGDFEVVLPDPGPFDGFAIQASEAMFRYSPTSPVIFSGLDLQIDCNTRIGLLGRNGAGKSTLVKLLLGDLQTTEGTCARSQFARIAYLAQHTVDMLNPHATPLESLLEIYPGDLSNDHVARARGYLATFGLGGDSLPNQQIHTLSGGQRFRICLALIMFSKPHVIVLDEPTNHLDLETLESLTNALKAFKGGIVIVSHDAHLITEVCNTLLVVGNGRVERWDGTFAQYAKQRRLEVQN